MDTQKDLNDYLVCALWSSTDDEGSPLDDNYDISDISDESFEQAKSEVAEFMNEANEHLHNNDKSQFPGHDFWLTRNGHGAGFWDGDYINGDKLTELSKNYGESYLYIGDDGKLYFS